MLMDARTTPRKSDARNFGLTPERLRKSRPGKTVRLISRARASEGDSRCAARRSAGPLRHFGRTPALQT